MLSRHGRESTFFQSLHNPIIIQSQTTIAALSDRSTLHFLTGVYMTSVAMINSFENVLKRVWMFSRQVSEVILITELLRGVFSASEVWNWAPTFWITHPFLSPGNFVTIRYKRQKDNNSCYSAKKFTFEFIHWMHLAWLPRKIKSLTFGTSLAVVVLSNLLQGNRIPVWSSGRW